MCLWRRRLRAAGLVGHLLGGMMAWALHLRDYRLGCAAGNTSVRRVACALPGDGKREPARLRCCFVDMAAEWRARCLFGPVEIIGAKRRLQIGLTWRACLTAANKFGGVNVYVGVNANGLWVLPGSLL